MIETERLLIPDWPAPDWVRAFSTTRRGGVSAPPFDSLNLSYAGGDDPSAVHENRRRVMGRDGAKPVWLKQVHGCQVVELTGRTAEPVPQLEADAAFTAAPDRQCVVLTADCLPLLICDVARRRVAAVHAGWRGLAAGVVEAALAAMEASPADTLIWAGPAIGRNRFEVGPDVLAAFCEQEPDDEIMFLQTDDRHWLADLFGLAVLRLARAGFHDVYGSECCTYGDPDRFFSYRRDGVTGRMATAISIRAAARPPI